MSDPLEILQFDRNGHAESISTHECSIVMLSLVRYSYVTIANFKPMESGYLYE